MVVQLCDDTRNTELCLYMKKVNGMSYELYLNKATIKN